MSKRRRLGQHQLIDNAFAEMIINIADVSNDDVVFELGTGGGCLTELLCPRVKKVISCELDPDLYREASARLSRYGNLELIQGDGFNVKRSFDVFISNLPYSQSSRFIQWSLNQSYRKAVITVQREFAEKLLAQPGQRMYRAISIIAQAGFRIEPAGDIPSCAFHPIPKVSSKILIIRPLPNGRLNRDNVLCVRKILSFRGRKVSAALKVLSKKTGLKPEEVIRGVEQALDDRRVEDLTVDEVFRIAENL